MHARVEERYAPARRPAWAISPARSPPRRLARLATIAHNLLRAAGSLASLTYAKARSAAIRRDLIDVAGRTVRHGHGHLTLHLPEGWHREHEWINLFAATCGTPAAPA